MQRKVHRRSCTEDAVRDSRGGQRLGFFQHLDEFVQGLQANRPKPDGVVGISKELVGGNVGQESR